MATHSTSSNSKHHITITPPLLNSANPWATNLDDLKVLYDCPHTGAVTVRTSLWKGFEQHPATQQYTFFSSNHGHSKSRINTEDFGKGRGEVLPDESSSLNTLGYSPVPFEEYVIMLVTASQIGELKTSPAKPFIVSVTGTAEEVGDMYAHLLRVVNEPDAVYPAPGMKSEGLSLMMEINLSCPNIPGKPPPAYGGSPLSEYITAISKTKFAASKTYTLPLHVGIKTPPYTYSDQFKVLISALEESTKLDGGCPISFITATNTLGSCLVLNEENEVALGSVNGSGIGGMAGDALHPIALGNVRTLRTMLDASRHEEIRKIAIIGVGGVRDAAGFRRMKVVGASAVGVGTALGREGVSVFEKISSGLSSEDLGPFDISYCS
jgi:dihydroorotate dehydrogenase (fumarate)